MLYNDVEIEELLKAEEERCIRYGSQWADRVRLLMKYRDDNGHCNAPCKHSSLGWWVRDQRVAFKKHVAGKVSSMTLHRVNILNHIGFVWDALEKCGGSKRNDEGWMRMLKQLMEYKEKHGDCIVPTKYDGNPKVGNWVNNQRRAYNDLKSGKQLR